MVLKKLLPHLATRGTYSPGIGGAMKRDVRKHWCDVPAEVGLLHMRIERHVLSGEDIDWKKMVNTFDLNIKI